MFVIFVHPYSGRRTAAAAFDFGLTREGRDHRGKVHTSTTDCALRAACLCLLKSLFAELRSVRAGGAVFVISDGDGDKKTVATRAATLSRWGRPPFCRAGGGGGVHAR